MSFNHKQTTTSNYVRLECSGQFSVTAMMELLELTFDAAITANRGAALIDLRTVSGPTPDTLQRYEMGARVASIQRDRGHFLRLAVVGNEPMIDPERFAAVVSGNRGASVRGFTDIVDAISWLDEGPAIRDPTD